MNEVINGRSSLIFAKKEKVTEGRARKTKLGSTLAQGLDSPLVRESSFNMTRGGGGRKL